MAHVFTVQFKGNAAELFRRAAENAARKGLSLSGDASGGAFGGMGVAGIYRVEGETVRVSLEKTPFFLPAAAVERQVRDFFGGG